MSAYPFRSVSRLQRAPGARAVSLVALSAAADWPRAFWLAAAGLTAAVVIALWCASGRAADANWPQFRGPRATGVVDATGLPVTWDSQTNVRWKAELPGRGWSSPIVWGKRIFVTTAVNTGETEELKKGLYFGGNRPEPPTSPHEYRVLCLDLDSGEILWNALAHEGVPQTPRHLKNSYASETPVTDGKRVYAYFGNLGVFCYDFEGRPLWSKRLDPQPTRYGWGTAASPVVHGDRLYLVNDNDADSYLLCLDAETGDELWRTPRDEKSNWATPYVWQHAGRTEIVTPGTGKVRSYDLEGNLLWEFGGMSSITIATPYEHDGRLIISSGYIGDKLRPIYAIEPGASGDISLPEDATSGPFVAWVNRKAGPYNPSTLALGELIYVLLDQGFFSCYDAKTGEAVYEKQRLPDGKAFSASPWAYDGKIFCINEDGLTFVIRAGRQFEIVGTNPLADDDLAMATPAIVGDRLLVRTDRRIYCLAQQPKVAEN